MDNQPGFIGKTLCDRELKMGISEISVPKKKKKSETA